MSQFYYIGSPVPIEVETYGSTKVNVESVEVIDDKNAVVNDNFQHAQEQGECTRRKLPER